MFEGHFLQRANLLFCFVSREQIFNLPTCTCVLHIKSSNSSIKKVKVKVVSQSCLTLCDPMDCSLPSSSVHGILQTKYWSGLPFPSPGDLSDPRIEPRSPTLQEDALTSHPPGKPTNSSIQLSKNTDGI